MFRAIKKYWLKALILALIMTAMALPFALPKGKKDEAETVERETTLVKRGSLKIAIETDGQVQAKRSVNVSLTTGWGQITWVIEEGVEVKKGELLMKLDDKRIKDQMENYEGRLAQDRLRVTEAEEQAKIDEAAIEKELAAAVLQLKLAGMECEKYGTVALGRESLLDEEAYLSAGAPAKGEAYQAYRDAVLAIKKAASDLERARVDFEGMDELLKKGFKTASDVRNTQLKLDEARRNLESTELKYQILRRFTYPMSLASKRQALDNAEAAFEKAELEAASKRFRGQSNIHYAKLSRQRRQKYYDVMQEQLDGCRIHSPIDGTVIYGDPSQSWSRGQISVGGRVWPGMRIFTFPDMSELIVESKVLEMDIYKVALDQAVDIEIEALPDVKFSGTVAEVAQSTAAKRWWRSSGDWIHFAVIVALDGTDDRLKPGMSCDVEIVTDMIEDAVYVPVPAVFTRGESKVCYVMRDGGREEMVEVTLGKSSEKYVQVLDGLEVGWRIVLADVEPEKKQEEKPKQKRVGSGAG